jgi:SPX domain protein involved in polyphosphate accumulation/uncharacterized membrane protein YidH (DUF202 family)
MDSDSTQSWDIPLLRQEESRPQSTGDVRLEVTKIPRPKNVRPGVDEDDEETFAAHVRENIFPSFKDHYADHARLMASVSAVRARRAGAEKQFVERLEFEWIKYTSFLRQTIAALDATAPTKSLRADVLQANRFAGLNRSILRKVVAAHDRVTTHGPLLPAWRFKLDESWHEPLVKILRKISAEYERERGDQSGIGVDQENFVRKSFKYFVRPEALIDVVAEVIPHLPVYTFTDEAPALCSVDSVYLDDTEHTTYQQRLLKRENSKLVRLRWYGNDQRHIYVERKVHHESWTGQDSSKNRFHLSNRQVLPFLRGQNVPDRPIAREIHGIVASNRLYPTVRTSYKRLAFQKRGSNTVRVSLDTELTMRRETTSHLEWFTPEGELSDSDVHQFPFAVLEIKLQGKFVEQPPIWVRHLMSSSALTAVDKFSKFSHATFALYPGLRVPYWIEEYADDFPALCAREKGSNVQPTSVLDWGRPEKKTIVEGVRVDPKAFFGIERTFMNWLQMALIILLVGISLLQVPAADALKGMAHTLIAAGSFLTLYALGRYYHRLDGLYHRKAIVYHDAYGPAILAVFLLAAAFVSEFSGTQQLLLNTNRL